MVIYKNLGGNSGVRSYELGNDFIRVQFNDGSIYTYNYRSAGRAHIETMKNLATIGQGLNSYIKTQVNYNYDSKS